MKAPKNINIDNSFLEEEIAMIALGNKDALSNIYYNTKHIVYGFSLSILKNIHEAEDILQEVFIKIYENADSYQANGKPLAWILTITKNLSLMKLRKKKHHEDIDELKDVLGEDKDKNNIENKILIETVFKHISDEERNILVLHSISGFKHREIAKMLELPLATVLSKYNRAIKKIKKRMGEEVYE